MSVVGALFDMDKTLIAENSASLYLKHRYEAGELSGWDLAKGLGAYLRYKLGVLDVQAWTKSMVVDFKGRRESEMIDEGKRLFDSVVRASAGLSRASGRVSAGAREVTIKIHATVSPRFVVVDEVGRAF